jgi:hypothetical protein
VADGVVQEPVAEPNPLLSRRLVVAYGVVVAVLLGIGVLAFVLFRPVHHKPFSSWVPVAKAPLIPQAIATHVAAEYKLPSGHPLTQIRDTPFALLNLPITVVGLGDVKTGRSAGIETMTGRSGAIFFLCGSGPKCAVPPQKSAEQALAYVEAEGLETALYTLHAQPFLRSVLVALPSDPNALPAYGLYVRRPWQKKLLAQPLSKTLGWSTPPALRALSDSDVTRISRLTIPYTFKLHFDQLPNGSVGMTLIPLRAAA